MIVCDNCLEKGFEPFCQEFNLLSHGVVQCVRCKTKYNIKVREIVIVDELLGD